MKCPKCNYVSFDYLDTCKKCGYDLAEYREERGIKVVKPEPMDIFGEKEKKDETLPESPEVSETPVEDKAREEEKEAIEIEPTLEKGVESETKKEKEEESIQDKAIEPIELEEPTDELEIEKGVSETEKKEDLGGDEVTKEERIIELDDLEGDTESLTEEALSGMEKKGTEETDTELEIEKGVSETEKKEDLGGDEVAKEERVIELDDLEGDTESLTEETLLKKQKEEIEESAPKEQEEKEESPPEKKDEPGSDSEIEKSDNPGEGDHKKGNEDRETKDVSKGGEAGNDSGPLVEEDLPEQEKEEKGDQENTTKKDDEESIKKKDLEETTEAKDSIPDKTEEIQEKESEEQDKKTDPLALEENAEGAEEAKTEDESKGEGEKADFKIRLIANIFDLCLLGLINIIFIFLSLFTIVGWDLVFSDFFSIALLGSQFSFSKLMFIFIFLLIFTGYFVYFLWRDGQTIGKMLLKVRVVSVDGQPLTLKKALLRSFSYLASILTLGIGFFWIKFDKNNEAWYDRISKTHVVKLYS